MKSSSSGSSSNSSSEQIDLQTVSREQYKQDLQTAVEELTTEYEEATRKYEAADDGPRKDALARRRQHLYQKRSLVRDRIERVDNRTPEFV